MTRSLRTLLPALSLFLWPTIAHAQEQESSVFDGDYLTIGAGLAYGPSFEGADEHSVFPMGGVMGRIGPVTINPRIAGIALDLIPDVGNKVSFTLGPVARARFERTRSIKDPAIAALGKRNTAIELGGTAGVSINRLTNPYDSLSFGVDVRWDVAKAHRGAVVAPSMTYLTPLSRATAVVFNVSAEHVDTAYARYYFDVSPAGAIASGLPGYTARGGWKNAGATLMGVVDLDGNLLNGGFALVGGVAYTRLLGSMRDSPIVSQRGSANQLVGALGVALTF
jgi:outer membrane scaffolding protein for murein synthesis (MipA/OmpV family)